MTKGKSTDIAVLNEARIAALREVSGAADSGTSWPSKLRVSRKPFAEDGTTLLPMGKHLITIDKVDHYLNEVDFIVMEKGTQFMRFSGKSYIGCTMIENTFQPEYKDSIGGTRLGRIPGQDYEEMTDAQKEVKFHFHMLGIADVSQAVDVAGERLYKGKEAIFVPVSVQYKGKKSVDKQNEFKKVKKKGEAYFDFITRLEVPFKDGDIEGVPYYNYHFARGDDVVLTDDVLDSIEATKSLIENENKRIYKKHLEAQAVGDSSAEDASYTDLEIVDED
jgi:hypothetical protein